MLHAVRRSQRLSLRGGNSSPLLRRVALCGH
jgi:hypothetical protein